MRISDWSSDVCSSDLAKRRCQERSVDETLRMREQVNSASAQAYWTRKAIGELRIAGGFTDRIAKLRAELRGLQDVTLDEFGQFSIRSEARRVGKEGVSKCRSRLSLAHLKIKKQ